MVDKHFSQNLASEIEAIPGQPCFNRSMEILQLLLKKAQVINENAPIISLLKKDINQSKSDSEIEPRIGHSISIKLESGNGNDALVRYLLVPMGGSQRKGRSVEFACRQFGFALIRGLTNCDCLRSTKSELYTEAVAAGVFYAEGKIKKNLVASAVSEKLWKEELTEVAKNNLGMVHKLIDAKMEDNEQEFTKIMADLAVKRS